MGKKNFFPKRKKEKPMQKPQQVPNNQPKYQTEFTPEELEEIKRTKEMDMLDPAKRFVLIDSDSFSVLVVGLLQIKESELTTALLRRRQDYDKK